MDKVNTGGGVIRRDGKYPHSFLGYRAKAVKKRVFYFTVMYY
jgi:hypothetical protein